MNLSKHWRTSWDLYRGATTAKTWRYSVHSLRKLSLRMLINSEMIFNLFKSTLKFWYLKRLFSLAAKITLSSMSRELFSKSLSSCTISCSKIARLTRLFNILRKICWSLWLADSQGNPFNFIKRSQESLHRRLIRTICPKAHQRHWVKLCKTKLISVELIKRKLKRLWWQTNAVILKFSNSFVLVPQSKS